MAQAVIGALRVNLSADTAAFSSGLTKAERRAQTFSRRIGKLVKGLATLASAAAAAAQAIGIVLVRSSLKTIDAQSKLARRVDGTVAAIQALDHAGDLAGISQEKLAKSLENLSTRLGEAQRRGMGPAAEALDRIGLSATELINLDVDDRIGRLADRFDELNLSAAQQADILRDLGVRNKELINLLEGGSAAIKAAREEIEKFGIAVSDVDAAQVEAANDAMTRIGLSVKGLANQLAVELAPVIVAAAEELRKLGEQGILSGAAVLDVLADVARAFAFVADVIQRTKVNLKGVGALFGLIEPSAEMLADAMADLPSEKLEAFLARVSESAKQTAASFARINEERRKLGGDGDDGGGGETEADQRLREERQRRLEILQESLLSERELELATFAQRLADLNEFHQAGLLSAKEFADLRTDVERDHAKALKEIDRQIVQDRRNEIANQVQDVLGFAKNINSVLGSLFGDNKAFAIAGAIVNTAQAVTKALAIYGPTPQGFAAATAAAASGAAQLATIRSASRKGGGNVSRPTTSVPATQQTAPGTDQAAGFGPTLNLTIAGEGIFTPERVEELVAQLIDFQRDGGTVVLAQ